MVTHDMVEHMVEHVQLNVHLHREADPLYAIKVSEKGRACSAECASA